MKELNVFIAVIAFTIFLLGLIKKRIEHSWISEPIIAVILGMIIGPGVLNLVPPGDPTDQMNVLHETVRFTLAMALMASALRIRTSFFREQGKQLLVLLFGGMVLMALISFIAFFILGLSFWESMIIAAVLTPTDPVMATTIVSGTYAQKHVHIKVRDLLSAESSANDGLAYPLVLFPLVFNGTDHPLFFNWFLRVVVVENLGAILLGGLLGYVASRSYSHFEKKQAMEPKTLISSTLLLAFFIISFFELIHLNGIIGVFAGGIVFYRYFSKKEEMYSEKVQNMMERLFLIPSFVLLGIINPWTEWSALSWGLLLCIPLILIIRRLPVLLMLKPFLKDLSLKDTLFMGYFGPVGVAALFYVSLISGRTAEFTSLWPVVSYSVFCSVIIYGITAYPFTQIYSASKGNINRKKG